MASSPAARPNSRRGARRGGTSGWHPRPSRPASRKARTCPPPRAPSQEGHVQRRARPRRHRAAHHSPNGPTRALGRVRPLRSRRRRVPTVRNQSSAGHFAASARKRPAWGRDGPDDDHDVVEDVHVHHDEVISGGLASSGPRSPRLRGCPDRTARRTGPFRPSRAETPTHERVLADVVPGVCQPAPEPIEDRQHYPAKGEVRILLNSPLRVAAAASARPAASATAAVS